MKSRFLTGLFATAVMTFIVAATASQAGELSDRIASGEPVRLGFANEIPFAYPGESGEPKGFVNAYVLGVLGTMGIDKVEPVVTEWGGLIPGLNANRFDIITGGMNILKSRCENMAFSEPMGTMGDAFIVPKGNPKGISNYQDIKDKDGILVTGAGYNSVEAAKKEGVPDDKVMQVPGPTEILAAVKAGRADAGAVTFFTAQNLAKESDGALEVTDPNALPEWTKNWVGIGFREADRDFLAKFNEAQAKYLGSPEMMKAVEEYGYSEAQLPGDVKLEWVCANR
ncbi:amino acid ABC transporter substrate-binding protein (PAAT family) [Hoeflea marina]|uniref:Amino acid ABC transporter substrate-binding protein (PAAT family) n=1 Tax=Hoeflea marina TaxID=274592 RepID=A0A317PUH0_9HYPH|nr:ectoine/hydroxyectoine ABC transporter substrate-binding protein EhuB [Hoeflea marina]PWW04577.1 amino acid ABC transporter substrate-binding protein (PAAT family) [Hoeflea marina]